MKKMKICFLISALLFSCTLLFADPKSSYENLYQKYLTHRQEGKRKEGVVFARQAYLLAKDNGIKPDYRLIFNLCWDLQLISPPDYEQAKIICSEAAVHYPRQKLIALQMKMNALLNTREYGEVEKIIQQELKALDESQFSEYLHAKLAEYYYYTGNLELSEKYARKAKKEDIQGFMPRIVTITHDYRLKIAVPKHYKSLKKDFVYIPLPMNTYYQEFLSLSSTPPQVSIVKKGRYNYAVYDFREDFPERLKMIIKVKTFSSARKIKELKNYENSADEPGFYANEHTRYYNYTDPLIAELVGKITAGKTSNLEKARAVYDWVSSNMIHDSRVTEEQKRELNQNMPKNIVSYLKAGYGDCAQISGLYIGMMRQLKIPVRSLFGMFYSLRSNNEIMATNHVTAEIYDPKQNEWIYVEPQGNPHYLSSNPKHIIYSFLPHGYFNKLKNYVNYIPISSIHGLNKRREDFGTEKYPVQYDVDFLVD